MLLRILLIFLLFPYPYQCANFTNDEETDFSGKEDVWEVPPELAMRCRILRIVPNLPVDIRWRWGGEGLGGQSQNGMLAERLVLNQWSSSIQLAEIVQVAPARFFLTVTCGLRGKVPEEEYSQNVDLEFEFTYKGKPIKRFREAGPNGGTVGLVIPFYRLGHNKNPLDPEFISELGGLLEYVDRRASHLQKMPWAHLPLPRKTAIVSDIAGYGEGISYGVRTTNPNVIAAEMRTLRQLGVNGLRNAPGFILNQMFDRDSSVGEFTRIRMINRMGFPVPRFRERQPDPEAGCPFAPGVSARTRSEVKEALADAMAIPVDEVWVRTVDEIGTVIDLSPERKKHLSVCDRCAKGFREYLKNNALKPSSVGKASWEKVRPLNIWDDSISNLRFLSNRGEAMLAYQTAMFNNYATARLFSPLRDAFQQANAAKQKAIVQKENIKTVSQPWIYSFALRGNTFLLEGHSLDFFDYYRHADNAFVYETSNRDPRIWGWDSYLCDVGRVVSADRNIEFGIYVKPHRGAPIQRALSALSRGAKMIHWYTYGPDWAKGDSFSGNAQVLEEVSRGARLIAASEEIIYGSSWAQPAQVGLVLPRSSEIWMRLSGKLHRWTAAWENAKWIYSALAHQHLPVDPLDEHMLAEKDLSRYRVLYVNGPNLTNQAASNVERWVKAGGILVTSGWALVADEMNLPLDRIQKVLGLQFRSQPEIWREVKLYDGKYLQSFDEPGIGSPHSTVIAGKAPFETSQPLLIGREVLHPYPETSVLARFADGSPAVTRNGYGKGAAFTIGFFPGLEYSAAVRKEGFDMSSDFAEGWRFLISEPARLAVKPPVEPDQPLVEAIPVKNKGTGKRAIVLMNWAYRMVGRSKGPVKPVLGNLLADKESEDEEAALIVNLIPSQDLKLKIYSSEPPPQKIISASLGIRLQIHRTKEGYEVTLPRLDEADVLLID